MKQFIRDIYLSRILKYFDKDLITVFLHAKNYFLATIILKASLLITIPLFTRYLTLEEYGIVSLFNSYLGIIIIVCPLYLYSSVGRYYYEKKPDFNAFVGTSIILSIATFLISTILILAKNLNFLSFSIKETILVYLLFIIAPFKIVSGIYFQIIIPERNSELVAKLQILEGYLNIIFSVCFVLFLPYKKYYGPIYGIMISSLIIFLYAIYQYKKIIIFNVKSAHIKYIILFSLPQLPYALSGVILEQFGRIIIGNSKKTSDLGIYSLGFQIAIIYSYFTSAIRTAVLPDFYKYLASKEYDKLTNLFKKIIAISVIPAFTLNAFAKELIYLLADKKFNSSYIIVPFIVMGYVFFDLFYIYSPYLEYKKHTWVLSLIILTGGIANIFLSYLFVSNFGYVGAGYSFVLSYFIIFCLTWGTLKLFYDIVITKLEIIAKPLIGFIVFSFFIIISQNYITSSLISFSFRLTFFASFIYINYLVNIKSNYKNLQI